MEEQLLELQPARGSLQERFEQEQLGAGLHPGMFALTASLAAYVHPDVQAAWMRYRQEQSA